MDIKTRAHCNIASSNARALEEILLTQNDVENIDESDAIDVIDRCEQIIKCMNMLLNSNT